MRATPLLELNPEPISRFTPEWAFNVAMGVAGLTAGLHIVWFMISFASFRRQIDSATVVIVDWDTSIYMMHIRIGIALLISTAALWRRRAVGLFISVIAVGWICTEYVAWYVWSARLKSDAGIEQFPPSVAHALNLYGARPLNVVVLALAVGVLLWEVEQLVKIANRYWIHRVNTRVPRS